MCTNIKKKRKRKKKEIINSVYPPLLLGSNIKEFVLKILLEQCCKLVIAFIKKGI